MRWAMVVESVSPIALFIMFVGQAEPARRVAAVVCAENGLRPRRFETQVRINALKVRESRVSGSPVCFAVAFPINVTAIVAHYSAAGLRLRLRLGNSLRLWLGLRRRRALAILKSQIAVGPILIGLALPINETAIVNRDRTAGLRLRLRLGNGLRLWLGLRRRRALAVLKCPIAVGPILIGLAFPIDKTAIVDVLP